MTRDVICVDAEDDIGQLAWLMAQRNLKRVPVLREGVLALIAFLGTVAFARFIEKGELPWRKT